MALVRPFPALRPLPSKVAEIASVPYDVVNTEEARALVRDHPWSFLHIGRAEIDLPADTDVHSDAVYRQAADNFNHWRRKCPLIQEEAASFYLYRLQMGDHCQTGLVACFSVDEYEQDIIRKHERTRLDKEQDRTRHILALRAQTGPVFLTCSRPAPWEELVGEVCLEPALFDFTASDDIRHMVWKVPQVKNQAWSQAFQTTPYFYIADGHHRAAAACRARRELAQANPGHCGNEEYNFFQAVLFPADQLQILPYNRAVRQLGNLSQGTLLDTLRGSFQIQEHVSPNPKKGEFSMYLNGIWYGLKPTLGPKSADPLDNLDVSILQDRLLAPILGIQDPRTDQNIEFIGGIRGTVELERLVGSGKAAVAFSLHPTTVADLMAISDAGQIMPPKSTWFEPKLRDGLLSHLI